MTTQSLDVLTILAILIGPVVAVQATSFLDRKRQKDERRRGIFRVLMATRANTTATEHVQALNAIDIEFADTGRRGEAVIASWRVYFDHLNSKPIAHGWGERRLDLLADMLHVMSFFLGYKFDVVYIKRTVYSPEAHDTLSREQTELRKVLIEFAKGEVAIPVKLASLDPSAVPAKGHAAK